MNTISFITNGPSWWQSYATIRLYIRMCILAYIHVTVIWFVPNEQDVINHIRLITIYYYYCIKLLLLSHISDVRFYLPSPYENFRLIFILYSKSIYQHWFGFHDEHVCRITLFKTSIFVSFDKNGLYSKMWLRKTRKENEFTRKVLKLKRIVAFRLLNATSFKMDKIMAHQNKSECELEKYHFSSK